MGILYSRTGELLPEVQDPLARASPLKPAALNLDKCIQEENSDLLQRICLMRICALKTAGAGCTRVHRVKRTQVPEDDHVLKMRMCLKKLSREWL